MASSLEQVLGQLVYHVILFDGHYLYFSLYFSTSVYLNMYDKKKFGFRESPVVQIGRASCRERV